MVKLTPVDLNGTVVVALHFINRKKTLLYLDKPTELEDTLWNSEIKSDEIEAFKVSECGNCFVIYF